MTNYLMSTNDNRPRGVKLKAAFFLFYTGGGRGGLLIYVFKTLGSNKGAGPPYEFFAPCIMFLNLIYPIKKVIYLPERTSPGALTSQGNQGNRM